MKKYILFTLLLLTFTLSVGDTLTVEELNELKATIIVGNGQALYFDYTNYLYQKEDNKQHREWILYLMTLATSREYQATFSGIAFVESHLWAELLLQEYLEPLVLEDFGVIENSTTTILDQEDNPLNNLMIIE